MISQEIGNDLDLQRSGSVSFLGSGWAFGGAGSLVVAGWVEGEVSECFACGGMDDADVEVGDEEDDGGSGVGSSDADVVESSVVAE